jgi:hypothetical protein
MPILKELAANVLKVGANIENKPSLTGGDLVGISNDMTKLVKFLRKGI